MTVINCGFTYIHVGTPCNPWTPFRTNRETIKMLIQWNEYCFSCFLRTRSIVRVGVLASSYIFSESLMTKCKGIQNDLFMCDWFEHCISYPFFYFLIFYLKFYFYLSLLSLLTQHNAPRFSMPLSIFNPHTDVLL